MGIYEFDPEDERNNMDKHTVTTGQIMIFGIALGALACFFVMAMWGLLFLPN